MFAAVERVNVRERRFGEVSQAGHGDRVVELNGNSLGSPRGFNLPPAVERECGSLGRSIGHQERRRNKAGKSYERFHKLRRLLHEFGLRPSPVSQKPGEWST